MPRAPSNQVSARQRSEAGLNSRAIDMNAFRSLGRAGVVLAALHFANVMLAASTPLSWDALAKTHQAEPGEALAHFVFSVTNVSSTTVVINAVRTSCGCTVAKLPSMPWVLAPGTNGQMEVNVDLRGKRGTISKVVSVDASGGVQLLTVNVTIPEPDPRENNRMMAQADRQAVFRGECATCHVQPAVGKRGPELYAAACGICHEAAHRASMVPDLHALGKPTDPAYWRSWITLGKVGSLMPSFAKVLGGPLDEEQVQSLVDHLTGGTRSRLAVDLGNPFPDRP